MMDALVLAHAALMVAINAPREGVASVLRIELERATNAHEQFFTDLRETVRASATFQALSAGEQRRIEQAIFSVASTGTGDA